MGLDTVELVLEIEDEFGIEIDDVDAPNILTVGTLIRYVARKKGICVEEEPRHVRLTYCASASAFYSLRRLLMAQFGSSRRDICPQSRIFDLVTEPRRKSLIDKLVLWGAHRKMLEAPDPGAVFFGSVVAGTIAVGMFSILRLDLTLPLPALAVVVSVAVALCGLLMLRRQFVVSRVSIADIVRQRASDIDAEWRAEESIRIESLIQRNESQDEATAIEEIRRRVYDLVADQFGVKVEAISDNTHFVRDLGA